VLRPVEFLRSSARSLTALGKVFLTIAHAVPCERHGAIAALAFLDVSLLMGYEYGPVRLTSPVRGRALSRHICHRSIEVAVQARMALRSINHSALPDRNRHTTMAKQMSPMLPIVAPRASSATAHLARSTPSMAADRFLSFTCFSTSVAVAGKIAGNARKRPPTTGPNDFAIMPVATVASPPKRNRRTISYHFVCRSAERLSRAAMLFEK
jgi:hypothetical protein